MTTHWIPEQLLEPGVGVILDTETTDLDGRIIEISIIDAATGTVLMDQLINPTLLDSPPGAEVAARKYLPRFSYGKFTMFEVMSARRTYGAKTVMVAG